MSSTEAPVLYVLDQTTFVVCFVVVVLFVKLLWKWCNKKAVPSRPTMFQLIGMHKQVHHPGFSLASANHAMYEYSPRSTDVLIATAPKTGTTWLQCICHHLRAGKPNFDYEDLYQVAPWMQMAQDLGMDVNAEQPFEPRIFKLHQRLSSLPANAKFIVTLRDPVATVISWYNFLKKKKIPSILAHKDVSAFVLNDTKFWRNGMRFGATLWEYYVEYFLCRHLPNVCVLVFEDMIKDLEGTLPVLADFMQVDYSDVSLREIARASDKKSMQAHESKFDESWAYKQLEKVGTVADLHGFAPTTRVTNGHKETLNAEALADLKEQWRLHVLPKTNMASYADMARVCSHLPQKRN